MTNIEHFKRTLNADNLCDKIMCTECPLIKDVFNPNTPCYKQMAKWANEPYKKGK